MQKIAIIFPFYNEAHRMRKDLLLQLLTWPNIHIYLANDGSTDGTLTQLESVAQAHNENCFVISHNKNQGKAGTIYSVVNKLLNVEVYSHIGYFDADFSTPVAEMQRMVTAQQQHPDSFITGSRVLLLNADISRRLYRHIIGRCIATVIDFNFKLGIYDTQCGAKLFPVAIAKVAFSRPFLTRWLFDAEIFIRLKKQDLLAKGVEFPLRKWTDVKGSKLNALHAFSIVRELLELNKYKNK